MSRTKLAAVLSAVLVVGSLLCLPGCNIEEIIATTSTENREQATREVTQTFDVDGPVKLQVQSSNGDIEVEAGDVAVVSATAVLVSHAETRELAEERVSAIRLQMAQEGNVISLGYIGSQQEEDVRKHSEVSFVVTVPMQTDVRIDSANGDAAIRGVAGSLEVQTANGHIDLDGLIGTIQAATANGGIDVQDAAGILDLQTSNGSIRIQHVEASVQAHTKNGAIDFSGTLIGDSHQLTAANGSITVSLPAATSVTIDASAPSGRISTNLPLVGDTEGNTWHADLNPPATASLFLRSANGSVRIVGQP